MHCFGRRLSEPQIQLTVRHRSTWDPMFQVSSPPPIESRSLTYYWRQSLVITGEIFPVSLSSHTPIKSVKQRASWALLWDFQVWVWEKASEMRFAMCNRSSGSVLRLLIGLCGINGLLVSGVSLWQRTSISVWVGLWPRLSKQCLFSGWKEAYTGKDSHRLQFAHIWGLHHNLNRFFYFLPSQDHLICKFIIALASHTLYSPFLSSTPSISMLKDYKNLSRGFEYST